MKNNSKTANKALWRILKIVAIIILAVVLTVVSLFCAVEVIAKRTEKIAKQIIDPKAAAYIAQTYPDTDFVADDAFFASKSNCYRVNVHSPSSPDTYFSIEYDYTSYELVRDTYEISVVGGYNTRERLTKDYHSRVRECLSSVDCLSSIRGDFCKYGEKSNSGYFSPDGLDASTLVLDHNYDVGQLGAQYGYLEVEAILPEEKISISSALEILTEIDRTLADSNIGYSLIKITIVDAEYPHTTSELYLYDIHPEDLYREDSLSYLQELWNEQEAHRQSLKEK